MQFPDDLDRETSLAVQDLPDTREFTRSKDDVPDSGFGPKWVLPSNDSQQYRNDGDCKKNVDQIPQGGGEKTQEPQNDQNDSDHVEHALDLLIFEW